MTKNRVVSRNEWLDARRQLLIDEKEHTRQRDDLTRRRQELPWVKVDKKYTFDTPSGKQSLADLFNGRSQLIIYHFMFGPEWSVGCPSCSMAADGINATFAHVAARDVTLMAVSRAPLPQLEAFKRRMGWQFDWASSNGSDFNQDYHVSFTPEQMAAGTFEYNYRTGGFALEEAPGASVFVKNEAREIFHTYSVYSRGLQPLLLAYDFLDMVPKGRDEADLQFSMAWVRHHDRYDNGYTVDKKTDYVVPLKTTADHCPSCAVEAKS